MALLRLLKKWLFILLPVLISIAIVFFLQVSNMGHYQLEGRFNLTTIAVFLGIVGSVGLLFGVLIRSRAINRQNTLLEEQQVYASQDRQRFMRSLDHELKNPLTAIRIATANLAEGSKDTQTIAEIRNIEEQTKRLSQLSGDLRKLASLNERRLDRSEIDIADLLRELHDMAAEHKDAHSRQLSVVLPAAPWPVPAVSGDRELLLLALFNLIDNAMKYSKSDDTVEIRATDESQSVRIDIADTGCGIEDSDSELVWDELYRGSSSRRVSGSGIGLALVKRIIDRHGGRVELTSRISTGTRVSVYLPITRD